MRPRPSENCCSFGEIFDAAYDEKFASLKVREAVTYFDKLTKDRRITRHLIEMHRQCLNLVKSSFRELKPRLPIDDLHEVAETNKREVSPEERKAEVVDVLTRVQEMTPQQVEEEQRIQQIMHSVSLGQWRGIQTVRACKKAWNCSQRTVYRYMDKARERLAEGRGSVLFGIEVSYGKTVAIRDAAIDEKDWRGAMAAQKHLDQISGVLAPQSVQINQQINISTHPMFRQTLDRIFTEIADELDDHPELLERVYHRLSNCLASTKNMLPTSGAIIVDAVDIQ